jgi:hypothetical protein
VTIEEPTLADKIIKLETQKRTAKDIQMGIY